MPDAFLPGPLWMIGCGNMGQAMLDGWTAGGVDPAHLSVVRPSGKDVGHNVRVTRTPPEDEVPAILVLAMKPHQLDQVTPVLAPVIDPRTLLVSILAGVETASLRARFPAPHMIVRAMPNLPVRLGKGVIALYSDDDDAAARALVTGIMAALGHAEWFDDQDLFQVCGLLTGAGPAFVFRFIEALGHAAADLGLPPDQSARLATAMVEGAAALAAASGETPQRLARRVASPGGTTEAGLRILDEDQALLKLVTRTLAAARARSQQMAADARPK